MSTGGDSPRCRSCDTYLAPSAIVCPICGAQTQLAPGPTERDADALTLDPDIPPPDPAALPPTMRRIDIFLIVIVLLLGVGLNFGLIRIDRQQQLNVWAMQGAQALSGGDREYWRKSTAWPPPGPVHVIYSEETISDDRSFLNDLLARIGLPITDDPIMVPIDKLDKIIEGLRASNPGGRYLQIVRLSSPLFAQLRVEYSAPELEGTPLFSWEETIGPPQLYGIQLVLLSALMIGAAAARWAVIETYRRQRQQEYDVYQDRRTDQRFAAQERLQSAHALAGAGEVAQALAAVNEVLRVLPRSRDAIELRQSLLHHDQGKVQQRLALAPRNGKAAPPASQLYLRVLGTPYAYQAPAGLDRISIGRQRRRTGPDDDSGNDVVMRVPGSDELSLRISRRHLEIRRIDEEYFVIDRSGGQTYLDGRTLPEGRPVRITSGNRLLIAGVLTLEVLLRTSNLGRKIDNVLQVNAPGGPSDQLVIEATIGNMLTEVRDA